MYTQLTNQAAYDAALFGIRAQGHKPSFDERMWACVYRNPDNPGIKCAAGHILPDELYDFQIENSTVLQIMEDDLCEDPDTGEAPHNLPVTAWLKRQVAGGLNLALLQALQHAHDDTLRSGSVEAYEQRMQMLATEYNLHYTPR